MTEINLLEKETLIRQVADTWYNRILDQTDRPKYAKKRTGIQVLVQQPTTRNIVNVRIYDPSMVAITLVSEKATRANMKGHVSSTNSRNLDLMQFGGAVTATFDGITIQASTSGLEEEEDVLVSIAELAVQFDRPMLEICTNIAQNGGQLPPEFFEKSNFLHRLLQMPAKP